MSSNELTEVTKKIRAMVRRGQYFITDHVTKDHPDRNIKKDDIKEVLLNGDIVAHIPLLRSGKPQFSGRSDRYRWNGMDQKDRLLSLLVVVENGVVVIHADLAKDEARKIYEREDAP